MNRPEEQLPQKRNKFGAIRVKGTPDGDFDSKAEYKRWCELKLLEKAGHIDLLERQVPYVLHAGRIPIGKIIIDFRYREPGFGFVLEDKKGGKATQTRLFKWKAKHLKAEYGHDIRIV
ncbi:MAG: DUF1064 domain-containing protein [Planctomycetota bacterium]